MKNFSGNAFVQTGNLIIMSNLNPDAAFAAELEIDKSFCSDSVCIQTCLIYTTVKVCFVAPSVDCIVRLDINFYLLFLQSVTLIHNQLLLYINSQHNWFI